MTKVELYLVDATEVSMYAQLVQAIEQKRMQQARAAGATREQAMQKAEDAALRAEQERVDLVAEVTVHESAADPVAAKQQEVTAAIDDIAMQRAITAYAQAKGIPAAKALLEKVGAKTASGVPAEKRAEVLAAMAGEQEGRETTV